jgi:hypothetical protein
MFLDEDGELQDIPDGLQISTLSGVKNPSKVYKPHRYWSQQLTDSYCGNLAIMDNTVRSDLLYFGYSRGEWFGSGTDECWLWVYGDPIWMELGSKIPDNIPEIQALLKRKKMRPQDLLSQLLHATEFMLSDVNGLDLIDFSTGELKPDGMPDSIFVLYKLKAGKVSATVYPSS